MFVLIITNLYNYFNCYNVSMVHNISKADSGVLAGLEDIPVQ